MSFSVLLKQISVIFLEMMLGVIGTLTGKITDRDSKFLSSLTMTFLVPLMVIGCAFVESSPELLIRLIEYIFCFFVLFVLTSFLCQLIGKALGFSKGKRAVLVGTAAMPNCGFVGIPLACSVVGMQEATFAVSAVLAAYNTWFFTYVTALFQEKPERDIRSLITPCNAATVIMIALMVLPITVPAPLQSFCTAFGNCTTPIALMIIGCTLARSNVKALLNTPFLYLVTVLRGIVFPVLFMLVLRLLPLDNLMRVTMGVLASCPSGSMAAVLAKQNDVEDELCGQAVAHSTLFMLITAPLMILLALHWFPLT